jgi:hypothetical protein
MLALAVPHQSRCMLWRLVLHMHALQVWMCHRPALRLRAGACVRCLLGSRIALPECSVRAHTSAVSRSALSRVLERVHATAFCRTAVAWFPACDSGRLQQLLCGGFGLLCSPLLSSSLQCATVHANSASCQSSKRTCSLLLAQTCIVQSTALAHCLLTCTRQSVLRSSVCRGRRCCLVDAHACRRH